MVSLQAGRSQSSSFFKNISKGDGEGFLSFEGDEDGDDGDDEDGGGGGGVEEEEGDIVCFDNRGEL